MVLAAGRTVAIRRGHEQESLSLFTTRSLITRYIYENEIDLSLVVWIDDE